MKTIFKTQLALLLLLAVGLVSARFAPAGYKVGDTVQDFSLKNVDGKMISLASNSQVKGYIITFTCNTCPVAKLYEERIIALDQKYASKGYPVLAIQPNDPGISPGDSYDLMQKRAKDKKYAFPYLVDETQAIAQTFGATNTPHVFVVKKDGDKFKVAYIGAIDNNSQDASQATKKYVEEAVDELLQGKAVTTPSAKAIGCGIKWKKA
ncbi:thioredoxin family protein [Cytophagaceae bacterium DM2B3-1]|uniref:Thioredoxin family protein n=1 Tax=Xanthocytophaga flava TaxID=3048013 RepID=A0ABT7CK88_9BACT|nr:thioredoxin family protein [Xanthocytophaga flavus]MDJ1494110.1 thioredoxin family protein [Xanthocytophaga flavus]